MPDTGARQNSKALTDFLDRPSELDTDIDRAAPWHLQMRGLLESLLRVLRAHPYASQLILEGEKQSDAGLVASETALAVLCRGGYDPDHAAAGPLSPPRGGGRADVVL